MTSTAIFWSFVIGVVIGFVFGFIAVDRAWSRYVKMLEKMLSNRNPGAK